MSQGRGERRKEKSKRMNRGLGREEGGRKEKKGRRKGDESEYKKKKVHIVRRSLLELSRSKVKVVETGFVFII